MRNDAEMTPLEREVFPYVCHGLGQAEIVALAPSHPPTAVKKAIWRLQEKCGTSRTELVLEHVESQFDTDALPLDEAREMAERIARLNPRERQALDTYLAQWQDYREVSDTDMPAPTRETVAAEMQCTVANVSAALKRAAAILGITDPRVHFYRLLRPYYAAKLYEATLPNANEPELDGLGEIEKAVYEQFGLGRTISEAAEALGISLRSVRMAYVRLLRKTGKTRLRIALEFVDLHCPDEHLPLEEFRRAAELIERLNEMQQTVLATFAQQWREYILAPTKRPLPSHESVAAVLGLRASSVGSRLTPAVALLELGPETYFHTEQMIRLYYMAQYYQLMELEQPPP